MQIVLHDIHESIPNIMRRLGYSFQKHVSDEMAFIRPLGSSGFPRFHIYTKTTNSTLILNIHLDQHKETYGKGTMHHGEYGNDGAVKEEVSRIEALTKTTSTPMMDFEP